MNDESKPLEPWVGTASGRGPNGHFAPGNRLASGNPLAKKHAQISKAIHDATTMEDVVEVWKGVIRDAKAGDDASRKIFFDRLLGRAVSAISIDDDGEAGVTVIQLVRTTVGGSSASD